ncbi:MAG: Asp/Glu racemase [Pseudomonadota bacterium]
MTGIVSSSRGLSRFGILVPFTNTNLEADFALMRPDGVSMHYSRLGGYDEDAIPDAAQMQGLGASELDESLRLLMGVKPDVVIYGCTSATLTHGPAFDRALSAKIKASTGAATVTAAGALVHALKALNTKKIGFASPYVPAINEMAIGFLKQEGAETIKRAEVAETLSNDGQGALSPQAVYELGLKADHPDADAVVLSCTDMRAVEIIEELEARIGKPVITSNQAMLFQALAAIGYPEPLKGFGTLLNRPR